MTRPSQTQPPAVSPDAGHASGHAHQRTVTLPVTPASVTLSRRTAQTALTAWGLPRTCSLLDTALLITTELVANSVRHATASPHLDLTLGLSPDELTIAVHDQDPRLPPWPPSTRGGPGRRGLGVLTTLIHGFGGHLQLHPDTGGSGKTVHAALPRTP